MKYPNYKALLLGAALLSGAGASQASDDAAARAPALPGWQTLAFEQQAFWATARSKIAIARDPNCPQQWQMSASSSVASNSEQVELTLAARDGRVIERRRLSSGKNRRYKRFDYQAEYVLRERRVPQDNSQATPDQWPLRNRQEIPYPKNSGDMAITNAYALLLLAERLLAGSDDTLDVAVHTDFNFYRVHMTRGDGIPVQADVQLADNTTVSGMRDTRAVTLQATPLGTLAEKPDFSLLGLHGRISLLFDRETGLLLQIRGTAPKLGAAEINLKSAALREPQE